METARELEFDFEERTERSPEFADESGAAIGDDGARKTMKFEDMMKEDEGEVLSVVSGFASDEMSVFGVTANDGQDGVQAIDGG
jgi:hypothetical protein